MKNCGTNSAAINVAANMPMTPVPIEWRLAAPAPAVIAIGSGRLAASREE